MVHEDKPTFEAEEELEFDFYLQWDWPAHIETSLRRLLWISLVEAVESNGAMPRHTAYIRWQIATYPEAPPAVLDFLATCEDRYLLERIAENPQTWSATLGRLAQSPYAEVRIAVAEHEKTPVDTLKMLTADESVDVRYSMAENPALPAKMLQQLATDENAYVANRATRTLARRNPASIEQFPQRPQQQQRKLG